MTTSEKPLSRREAYTVREARELLGGICQATAYALIKRGELRTFRVGRRRLVSADAIRDYIARAERRALDVAL